MGSLDTLRNAPNEDIVSAIQACRSVILAFVFLILLIWGFGSQRYFHDKKQERRDREQDRTELIKTIIQINEEVLMRHGLIKTVERKSNG